MEKENQNLKMHIFLVFSKNNAQHMCLPIVQIGKALP